MSYIYLKHATIIDFMSQVLFYFNGNFLREIFYMLLHVFIKKLFRRWLFLHNLLQLTAEEEKVAKHIEKYFKVKNMSMQDKIFNAMLIAQHDLDTHNFTSENERIKIANFKGVLDSLSRKIYS